MPETNTNAPTLNKLPFWFADAMLVAAAATLVAVGARPLRVWEMVAVTVCVAFGGWLAVLPFLKEYELASRFAETNRLADTTAKLQELAGLHAQGILSDEEFAAAKAKALGI